MATWVANGTPGTTSATLPAGTAVGDTVVVCCYNDTATAPTLPTDWLSAVTRNIATAVLIAYRKYDGVWTMPTFATAVRCTSTTLRPAASMTVVLGATGNQGGTSTTWTWAALTLNVTNGSSVLIRYGAGTRPDAAPPTPANHTLIDSNGTRPGHIVCRKNSTTDGATVSITTARNALFSTAQAEFKDAVPPKTGTATASWSTTQTASGVAPIAAAVTQAAYQFFDDAGTESGAAPLAALNTSVIGNLNNGDGYGVLRIRLQSTSARNLDATDDWNIEYEKNASGTWIAAGLSAPAVKAHSNPNLPSATPTTNRLGAGTGSFETGKTSSGPNLTVTDLGWSANNFTEAIWPLQLIASALADGDVLRFRVIRNGFTVGMTYTATPTINIIRAQQGTAVVSHDWTATATGTVPEPPGEGAADVSHDWTVSAVGSNVVAPALPIPATGLVGWWDADDASTFTYSSGAVVAQWNDKSGQGRHFAQATTSLQPVRNGTLNGRTAVTFDGTDDYMDTAVFTLPQPITAFLMMDLIGDGTQGFLSSVGGSYQAYVGAGQVFFYCGTTPSGISAGSAYSGAHHWRFTANGASTTVHSDGVQKVIGDTGTAGTTTGFRIAERNLTAGYRLNGKMCEIVVYDRVLTAPEITQVESYLTTKWLTAGPPPSTGSATVAWSETITAAGKAGPGRGSATASWTETQTAAGKKPTKSITVTAQWAETITAAGKKPTKSITTTTQWSETLVAAGKRPTKSTSITAAHTWVSTASGTAPIVGVNQGSAIASWSETITASGKKPLGGSAAVSWSETITGAGKKPTKSVSITTSWAETQTAAGKKPSKSSAVTAQHSWTQTASGIAPIPGVKQGTAAVTHTWTQTGVGKKTTKSISITASHSWTQTAAGKKPTKSISITAQWAETQTAAGKRPTKSTSIIARWDETQTAAGKKTPKSITVVAAHTWTQIASGIRPIPGVKQGTANARHDWTQTAPGKKPSKSLSITVVHSWTQTGTGSKPALAVKQGSAIATHTWVTGGAAGKRVPKSGANAVSTWTVTGAGKRVPKSGVTVVIHLWQITAIGNGASGGKAEVTHSWTTSADGFTLRDGYWNDQLVIGMQYEDQKVIEWLLSP